MSTDDHLRREIHEAFAPVFADLGRVMRAMWEALGGEEGIARLTADVERLDVERKRWEAEHPGLRFGQPCHCWCRLRGHDSIACDGRAVTFEVRSLDGAPVQVPQCRPCADLTRTAPNRAARRRRGLFRRS